MTVPDMRAEVERRLSLAGEHATAYWARAEQAYLDEGGHANEAPSIAVHRAMITTMLDVPDAAMDADDRANLATAKALEEKVCEHLGLDAEQRARFWSVHHYHLCSTLHLRDPFMPVYICLLARRSTAERMLASLIGDDEAHALSLQAWRTARGYDA